jgi:hypothetical protein
MTTLPNSPWATGTSARGEVAEFRDRLKSAQPAQTGGWRGLLIFALDATASREPTWDHACRMQGEMFGATATLGGLDLQLVYYRGLSECKAPRWLILRGRIWVTGDEFDFGGPAVAAKAA